MNSFDEQAVPDLNSEAIDFRAASELFAPYRQLTAQASSTLRITTEHQGHQVPTIGGLLLFGKDRFARFPDAWIQAGRFAGTNRARSIGTCWRPPLTSAWWDGPFRGSQGAGPAYGEPPQFQTVSPILGRFKRKRRRPMWIGVTGMGNGGMTCRKGASWQC
jgi:hypothetical protein